MSTPSATDPATGPRALARRGPRRPSTGIAGLAVAVTLAFVVAPGPTTAARAATDEANQAPRIVITSPVAGTVSRPSGRYRLSATATDPEDGVLPPSALLWTPVVRGGPLDGHELLPPKKRGNDLWIDGPTANELEQMVPDAHVEIRVTATDSAGASTTARLDMPILAVPVTITTDVPGLPVQILGKELTTPVTFTSWVGQGVGVSVPMTTVDGRFYAIDSWSDGVAGPFRGVTTPAAPLTLTGYGSFRGVQARFFDNVDLTGRFVDRWDRQILAVGWDSPPPPEVGDDFSVRWTAQVIPEYSATYHFHAMSDGGARLWVDGRLLVDDFTGRSVSEDPTVALTAGVPVAVVMETRTSNAGEHRVELRWRRETGSYEYDNWIPVEAFRPRYWINFQPPSAPRPPGYLADTGARFAQHGGLRYGWSADRTAWTRDRDVLTAKPSDQLRDTFVHLRGATWELELPRGTYRVTAVSGDPRFSDSVHRIDAEGVPLVAGTPSTTNRFITGTAVVPVTDGRLTLTTGTGGENVKLNYVTVELR